MRRPDFASAAFVGFLLALSSDGRWRSAAVPDAGDWALLLELP